MDDKIFEDIKRKIEETDWSEVIKRENEERTKGIARVGNRDYLDWFRRFMEKLPKGFDNEAYAYNHLEHSEEITAQDKRNIEDFSHLHNFLVVVADIQRVKEYYDGRWFEEYEYVFKYGNRYYEWNTLVGQGSITTIKVIDLPDFAFINLDLYFKRLEEGHPLEKYKNLKKSEESIDN